jgi:alpha-ketoglutarate-dependent taurine dioxygenase
LVGSREAFGGSLRQSLGRNNFATESVLADDALRVDLAASLVRHGYVFLKSWYPGIPSDRVAQSCGRQLRFGRAESVHQVIPRASAGINHYSGIFGLGAFPFHTDMAHWREPPRYMMLRCVKGYGGVSTDLLDSSHVLSRVGRSELSRALVKPRRPLRGLLPLMSLHRPRGAGRDALFRWDEIFLVPASPAGMQGILLVKEAMASLPQTSIALEDPGDTLWIDNWRMLHGRSSVKVTESDRVIDRSYFGEVY